MQKTLENKANSDGKTVFHIRMNARERFEMPDFTLQTRIAHSKR
ncbi:MAG: hypothetical protein RLZ07_997 [Pseudomonadota bacterium]|jgi:hypothetical protein